MSNVCIYAIQPQSVEYWRERLGEDGYARSLVRLREFIKKHGTPKDREKLFASGSTGLGRLLFEEARMRERDYLYRALRGFRRLTKIPQIKVCRLCVNPGATFEVGPAKVESGERFETFERIISALCEVEDIPTSMVYLQARGWGFQVRRHEGHCKHGKVARYGLWVERPVDGDVHSREYLLGSSLYRE